MNSNGNRKSVTPATLVVALGIIYGDIGTSPLYVMKAIAGDRPVTELLVLGSLSCVFWTLVIQTTIKYIFLTLQADNHGEGGIFSLYALVRRYSRYLVIPTILGATTLLADGIITPPISVASAVEGLTGIRGFEQLPTVPVVLVILSLLFFFQRFGTHRVGSTFGPAMVVWFTMLAILGLIQITNNPGIFRALNPSWALRFLFAHPQGFWLLGAVFLATTGAEALYSDLGHCGRNNIRITWGFVKTSLLLNYLGQGAWMLSLGEQATLAGRNPFYAMMPVWFQIPGVIIATLATIIASQAMISGSFTLVNEAMNLNFWPRVAVRQPTEMKGQIYIPSVNNILWAGCILMVLYFQTSTHMEAAYGFSISITMMMTTILLIHFLYYKLRWNGIVVWALLLFFFLVESSFLVANTAKIKERWMFLFFELFIFLTMYIWYYARKINNRFTRFVEIGRFIPQIKALQQDSSLPGYASHLVYLTKANHRHEVEEKIINSILARRPKRADVYWLVHLNRTEEPYTLSYNVTELVENLMIKININIGFRVQPRTELYFKTILQNLITGNEMKLGMINNGNRHYNEEPDFRFIIIEKFLSVENEFTFREGFLLKAYFLLKRFGLSDEKAFGLDKSDVEIEQVPLVYQKIRKFDLTRECSPAIH